MCLSGCTPREKPEGESAKECKGTTEKCPKTPVKPTLKAKVVIIKGSYWDSEEGKKKIAEQLAEAEKIMGIKIETGEYEILDDSNLKQIDGGQWNGTINYSDEQVNLMNKLGTNDTPAMVFTDDSGDGNAITVSTAWSGSDDNLQHEGIIVGKNGSDTVVPHELGHLLSRESGNNTHSPDQKNLMYGPANRTGTEWTEPWKSSAENSSYLKK
jgi:hypothetical protein